ncbi:MAG TPA: hypothetical protein PLZ84_08220, partial [Clostridia bacterium]|nr:hypothetical protein [Clostridia bacterium]
RLPDSWKGYTVEQWTFVTPQGTVTGDFSCEKTGDGYKFNLKIRDSKTIPCLEIVLPDGQSKKRLVYKNVNEVNIN